MQTNTYYAQIDLLGYPIPGTLQSTPYSKIPIGTVLIPAANVVPSGGQVVVPHKGGLRYFVRHDKIGKIISNSLIMSIKKPDGLVYEFQLVK